MANPQKNAPSLLTGDMITWDKFPNSLKADDELKKHIFNKLNPDIRKKIESWNPGDPDIEDKKKLIVDDLNRILHDKQIYNQDLFRELKLCMEARLFVKKGIENLRNDEIIRLNRLIFEIVFPDEISKDPNSMLAQVQKDVMEKLELELKEAELALKKSEKEVKDAEYDNITSFFQKYSGVIVSLLVILFSFSQFYLGFVEQKKMNKDSKTLNDINTNIKKEQSRIQELELDVKQKTLWIQMSKIVFEQSEILFSDKADKDTDHKYNCTLKTLIFTFKNVDHEELATFITNLAASSSSKIKVESGEKVKDTTKGVMAVQQLEKQGIKVQEKAPPENIDKGQRENKDITIYMQCQEPANMELVKNVQNEFIKAGFKVPGIEYTKAPTKGDIRYFHAVDEKFAEEVKKKADELFKRHLSEFKLEKINLEPVYSKDVSKGIIEVWIPKSEFGVLMFHTDKLSDAKNQVGKINKIFNLSSTFYTAEIFKKSNSNWYVVIVTGFENRDGAERFLERVRNYKKHYQSAYIRNVYSWISRYKAEKIYPKKKTNK